ncbi:MULTISPECIES: DNA replication/repair protein RecF [Sphingomonadales]|uniref:DNA replication and repair protein RecF n=2 Tax=Edaphosphingomonas TaxID=3423724 RepID=A0A2T4I010_9SPHN|nr:MULTISPECIES: DNA replication/repair protein RecF [Sphingomonas]AGH50043.1 recombination protein F [Sphingomonas sp. MM-1]MDX3883094.1 DNA replication/repair protein RecF [Sphingomonas sp.]OHT18401.1 DNA replication and repair protein RecF [Sphingomonas haloaromaticamans]PTD22080.1 DNA replication and repair protein RecF [Sphingomonas fennica]
MAVTRLALTDFRSYGQALLACEPGLIVLTGENGAGKTNILEAVSLLTPGRGLRGAALSEMARSDGPGGFAVAARLAGDVEIGTGTLASAPERRQVRINGAAASANALSEWLAVLWLTPAMDRLFVEGAGGRRRFLDRLVLALEPGHAAHAARYEAAMRARNRLLAEERDSGRRADPAWLASLEAAMAEHGAAVAEARARTVTALDERIARQPEGPFARAALAIEGGEAMAEAALREALAAGRARDAVAGRTLTGPHRADLAVIHRAKGQPAARASTGEQKALLLGIVLAHADLVAERVGRRPVLLLDEVAAHLDPLRRAALFDRLAAGGGQVWMTGTEPALFEAAPAGAQHLTVAAGAVVPVAHPSRS